MSDEITLTVIKADVGGYVGHSSMHPALMEEAEERLESAKRGGLLVGPRDMFDDPGFDEARCFCNIIADYLMRHGPFEPHRLPLDEMEYTTMPQVMKRLAGRFEPLEG